MTPSDQSSLTIRDTVTEVEVINDLEQRGLRGLDTLSLEELQLLTERKRKQIHLEATEKLSQLEGEISCIDISIQELSAKKVTLTEELNAVMKSLGLPASKGERPARREPRKPKKSAETPTAPDSGT